MISFLLMLEGAAQEQNDYLKSSQERHSFDKKKWNETRETMLKEARGNKHAVENDNYDLTPNDVTTEGEHEGDFYKYEEENFEGEYADYESEDYYNSKEQDDRELNENDYNSGTDNYTPKERDVDYGKNKYHPEERENRYHKPSKSTESSGRGGSSILMYLLFGVLIALLAFLIYQLFMKTSLDDKGKKVVIPLEELEPTHIPKSELELLLEKALTDENYREAIRIYFIFVIKDLSEKEWIRWEKKKTNFSYLVEMRSRTQYGLFNEVVSVFEYAWYGNYPIQRVDFEGIEPTFKALLTSLKQEA